MLILENILDNAAQELNKFQQKAWDTISYENLDEKIDFLLRALKGKLSESLEKDLKAIENLNLNEDYFDKIKDSKSNIARVIISKLHNLDLETQIKLISLNDFEITSNIVCRNNLDKVVIDLLEIDSNSKIRRVAFLQRQNYKRKKTNIEIIPINFEILKNDYKNVQF